MFTTSTCVPQTNSRWVSEMKIEVNVFGLFCSPARFPACNLLKRDTTRKPQRVRSDVPSPTYLASAGMFREIRCFTTQISFRRNIHLFKYRPKRVHTVDVSDPVMKMYSRHDRHGDRTPLHSLIARLYCEQCWFMCQYYDIDGDIVCS